MNYLLERTIWKNINIIINHITDLWDKSSNTCLRYSNTQKCIGKDREIIFLQFTINVLLILFEDVSNNLCTDQGIKSPTHSGKSSSYKPNILLFLKKYKILALLEDGRKRTNWWKINLYIIIVLDKRKKSQLYFNLGPVGH